MIRFSTNLILRAFAGAAIAGLVSISSGHAQKTSPFPGMAGNWSGTGTIILNTGAKERIRCRALYKVSESGADLQLELRCASDSYKFELQSTVGHKDGAISGTWSEISRGAIGTIAGTATGNQITLKASSPVFSATLVVNTRGTTQSISIQSPGNEISGVSINLSRGK